MPVNKNAMTRYKILDDLLSDKYHNYSLDDLTRCVNEKLNEMGVDSVSRRSVEKDINYIEFEGPFMAEIDRYSADGFKGDTQKSCKKRCLRYTDPAFSIFKKPMSDDERYLLSEALTMLGQFDGLPNLESLKNLRDNLQVNTPKNRAISFTKNPLENSSLLGELFLAITNKQVLEIDYRKFSTKDIPNKFIVHPYLLKEYNRRWHLIALNNEYNSIINLALDRIKTVTPAPQYTYKEQDDEILDYFDDIVGLTYIKNNPIEKILFWVSDESKDYVATKPLHETQVFYHKEQDEIYRNEYPNLKGGYFFSIDCRKNYELISQFCSYGKNLVVLSPESIKKEIINIINELASTYLNLRK